MKFTKPEALMMLAMAFAVSAAPALTPRRDAAVAADDDEDNDDNQVPPRPRRHSR